MFDMQILNFGIMIGRISEKLKAGESPDKIQKELTEKIGNSFMGSDGCVQVIGHINYNLITYTQNFVIIVREFHSREKLCNNKEAVNVIIGAVNDLSEYLRNRVQEIEKEDSKKVFRCEAEGATGDAGFYKEIKEIPNIWVQINNGFLFG